VQEKVKSPDNTKDQAQNAVVSMGERKYLETFSRRSRLISVDSTTVMVQSEHERETTHTFRLQFALGINIGLLRGAQERFGTFGTFGTVANGMSWAHRYGEAHHTVVDEVEGAEWSKDQGSLVVYSRESAMVIDTEAETEEILDIPPINSYGGQKVQGYLDDSEHSEWVTQHMEEFSKQMGVSIEGFESVAMNLFVDGEKRGEEFQ
jgi:hypothetical protein